MTQLTSSNQVMLRKHIGSIQFRLQIVKMESSFWVLSENWNLDSSSRVVVLSEKVNKGLVLSQVERKERKFSPRISDEVYYSLLTSLCRPFWCPLCYILEFSVSSFVFSLLLSLLCLWKFDLSFFSSFPARIGKHDTTPLLVTQARRKLFAVFFPFSGER